MIRVSYTQNVRGKYDVFIESGPSCRIYIRYDLTRDQRNYFIRQMRQLLDRPASQLK